MARTKHLAFDTLQQQVDLALQEDLGPQQRDLTAELIDADRQASARLISRHPALVCGVAWADACFKTVDPSLRIQWQVDDGDWVQADQPWMIVKGNARAILTAERTAMNFCKPFPERDHDIGPPRRVRRPWHSVIGYP